MIAKDVLKVHKQKMCRRYTRKMMHRRYTRTRGTVIAKEVQKVHTQNRYYIGRIRGTKGTHANEVEWLRKR